MTRSAWTREELAGHALAWLVDLTFAGLTIRAATHDVDVESDAGDLHYLGGLAPIRLQRALDLFSLTADDVPATVEGYVPGDLVTAWGEGHRLEGAAVQLSQVRVRLDGTAVDAWEDRRVLVTGAVRDGQIGNRTQGATFVRFGIERPRLVSRRQVPSRTAAVHRATWPVDFLSSEDIGAAYPLVFGYPGRDELDPDGCMPALRACWITKAYQYHVLCVGPAATDATSVRLFAKYETVGVDVDVGTTYDDGAAIVSATDRRGTLLSVVDFHGSGYYSAAGPPNEITGDVQPPVEEGPDDRVFVGFTGTGGGGLTYGGQLVRDAGDVLAYMLAESGLPVDQGRVEAARPALSRFKIDGSITESVDPWEWVRDQLLPLLPVSLVYGESGIYPVVWDPDASVRRSIDVGETMFDRSVVLTEDGSNIVNRVSITYGYNARTARNRYTRRVGPVFEDSTDYASAELRTERFSLSSFGRLFLTWSTVGMDGDGARIVATAAAAEALSWDATSRTLTLEYVSGTSTAETLAATINGSPVGKCTARAGGDSPTAFWGASLSISSCTFRVADYGTAASSVCARSWSRLGGTDQAIREATIETDLVYDHGTALAILDWHALAYGGPRAELSFSAEEVELADLDLGDTITVSDSIAGLPETRAIIEGIEESSSGTTSIRAVILDG